MATKSVKIPEVVLTKVQTVKILQARADEAYKRYWTARVELYELVREHFDVEPIIMENILLDVLKQKKVKNG